MTNLCIAIYNNFEASVRDFDSDIRISDAKWNRLFERLSHLFSAIYFEGDRAWQIDEHFEQTIDLLAEKRLLSKGKSVTEISSNYSLTP